MADERRDKESAGTVTRAVRNGGRMVDVPGGAVPPHSRARVRPGPALRIHAVLIVAGLAVAFPFYWMVITSLKTASETTSIPPTLFPKALTFSNYAEVWRAAPFGRYFVNTVGIAGCVTLGVLVTSALAGHAFARMRFPAGRCSLSCCCDLDDPFEVLLIPTTS